MPARASLAVLGVSIVLAFAPFIAAQRPAPLLQGWGGAARGLAESAAGGAAQQPPRLRPAIFRVPVRPGSDAPERIWT